MDFATFVRLVGANVRRARWAAGKTQEELAAEALTFRLLSELERGHGNPTLRTLFQLARALGVNVTDLVDVVDAPSRQPRSVLRVEAPKRGRKPKARRANRKT